MQNTGLPAVAFMSSVALAKEEAKEGTPEHRNTGVFLRVNFSQASRHGWLIVFVIALLIFSWLHSVSTFSDPDAYYHGVLAQAAWSGHIPTALPQAWFTELRDQFTDQHLLYHIILGPFVALFGVAVGLKIASALLGAGAVATFYAVVRALGVRQAWMPTVLLLLTPAWLYRLGLVKVTPLSLIILLVGILLAVRRRPLALAALAWIYVYVYVGFLLLPLVVTVLLFVDWGAGRIQDKEREIKNTGNTENTRQLLKPTTYNLKPTRLLVVGAVWLGAAIGLIVNPYFPGNIHQFYVQFMAIGVVNQSGIEVAGEWYPALLQWMLTHATVSFVAMALAVVAAAAAPRRKLVAGFTAIALCALVFTVRSRRYIEYFAPLALLAAAVALHCPTAVCQWLKRVSRRVLVVGVCLAIAGVAVLGVIELRQVRGALNNFFPASGMGAACDWLKQNVPPNTMVFNVNWGEWPLFYGCTQELRYVAGLDMRFMYRSYPELAQRYQRIARGELSGPELTRTISQDFKAQYVVVTDNNPNAATALATAPGLVKVYHDPRVAIYKLSQP